jgi:hypothetical protein
MWPVVVGRVLVAVVRDATVAVEPVFFVTTCCATWVAAGAAARGAVVAIAALPDKKAPAARIAKGRFLFIALLLVSGVRERDVVGAIIRLRTHRGDGRRMTVRS